MQDAAIGMEYLHLKNIVHFDLKCDNLLVNLGDPDRPICKVKFDTMYVCMYVCSLWLNLSYFYFYFFKVGDFGLSRMKRNSLVSGGARGTLPWIAPELLDGSSTRVSEKVRIIWSFCIIYSVLLFFYLIMAYGIC